MFNKNASVANVVVRLFVLVKSFLGANYMR